MSKLTLLNQPSPGALIWRRGLYTSPQRPELYQEASFASKQLTRRIVLTGQDNARLREPPGRTFP
jgi:hypothetical protein